MVNKGQRDRRDILGGLMTLRHLWRFPLPVFSPAVSLLGVSRVS